MKNFKVSVLDLLKSVYLNKSIEVYEHFVLCTDGTYESVLNLKNYERLTSTSEPFNWELFDKEKGFLSPYGTKTQPTKTVCLGKLKIVGVQLLDENLAQFVMENGGFVGVDLLMEYED